MVVDVLVTQQKAEQPLGDQLPHRMLDPPLAPVVLETGRQPRRQVEQRVGLAQQQRAAVGAEPTAIADHLAVSEGLKFKLQRFTVCRHGVLLRGRCSDLTQLHILRIGGPMQSFLVRYPG